MRILFVHQNFPGQFVHLASALAARKHEVVALAINRRSPLPNIKTIFYKPQRSSSTQIHPFALDFETKLIRAEACTAAAAQLKQSGFYPDVIYAHTGWGESLFLKDIWPQAKLLGYFEFYYHVHGADCNFDPEFSKQTVQEAMRIRAKNASQLLALEQADYGVSPTQWQWSTFPSSYQDKISVIHDGIDTAQVMPDPKVRMQFSRDNLTLTPQDEVITFVSRNLEPCRGYHRFMRALPEIMARRPQVHVVIVGSDGVSYGVAPAAGQTYRQQFFEEVKDRVDLARIHFLGKIPYEDFLRVMQVSSVHVYLTYPFVLSWSMLEAMAAQALVVGSATAPVTEVIRDGENGLLVDFFSSEDLVNAICRVLEHPDRMLEIRKQARRTIVERFDLRTICLPRQIQLIEEFGVLTVTKCPATDSDRS
jgi:glycosyltransferase involved in cell wall biosynthesis